MHNKINIIFYPEGNFSEIGDEDIDLFTNYYYRYIYNIYHCDYDLNNSDEEQDEEYNNYFQESYEEDEERDNYYEENSKDDEIEKLYSIENQLDDYKNLFFFPFSMILKNQTNLSNGYDFTTLNNDIEKYIKRFSSNREIQLDSVLTNFIKIVKFKKYTKVEKEFLSSPTLSELESNTKKLLTEYIKSIFIKITFDTLTSKDYKSKVRKIKKLYPYMSKKRWFNFFISEITNFLKDYYKSYNFNYKSIYIFSKDLENNNKEDISDILADVNLQEVNNLELDLNINSNFIIKSYISFFKSSLIELDKDINLSNNRHEKMVIKKRNFFNTICEYYLGEKNIIERYNLHQREINLLTSNHLLNSIDTYKYFLSQLYEKDFSKESLEKIRQKKLNFSMDNLHIIISKIWIYFDCLSPDTLIKVKKLLMSIINIIRKENNLNSYRTRTLKDNEYLEKFKLEILNFNFLNATTQNTIYKRLLKISKLLSEDNVE